MDLTVREQRVVAGPVGEHGLPQGDELGRRERLLGRDPQLTRLWVHLEVPRSEIGAERTARTTVRSAEKVLGA
jgi:hypothetical protein